MIRRIAFAALVAFGVTAASGAACAAEPSPEADSADLAAFVAWAEQSDRPVRTYRLVGGLAGLGVGGLVTPVGAAMYSRDSGVASGVVLGVGIGTAVGGALVLLGSTPGPHGDAADAVAREKSLGRSDRVALAVGEDVLRQAAAEERLTRHVGAGIFLGLSVIALGLGTTFAAGDFTGDSFDRGDQDGVAAALLVGGALGSMGALEMLLFPMPMETSWEGYAAARKLTASTGPRVTSFGVSPLVAGGAQVALGGSF